MSYIITPIMESPLYESVKEAKQAAVALAMDGKTYVVAKLIGTTKFNPTFVKFKEPKASDISTEIPLSARCDFDGKPALASKKSATGDTVYLCLECLGGQDDTTNG